jgi:hypothetical protein
VSQQLAAAQTHVEAATAAHAASEAQRLEDQATATSNAQVTEAALELARVEAANAEIAHRNAAEAIAQEINRLEESLATAAKRHDEDRQEFSQREANWLAEKEAAAPQAESARGVLQEEIATLKAAIESAKDEAIAANAVHETRAIQWQVEMNATKELAETTVAKASAEVEALTVKMQKCESTMQQRASEHAMKEEAFQRDLASAKASHAEASAANQQALRELHGELAKTIAAAAADAESAQEAMTSLQSSSATALKRAEEAKIFAEDEANNLEHALKELQVRKRELTKLCFMDHIVSC